MINLIIPRFGAPGFAVSRASAGSTINGRYTPGTPTTFSITASVQPGDKTRTGSRHTEDATATYTVFTATALLLGDILTVGGSEYEVFRLETWELRGSIHHVALVKAVAS